MIEGLVSTIIPVHNRPAMLREAVASVLSQTYRPIEIIIVDDGSTDGTAGVASDLAAAHPSEVRVLHQPNEGPGAAREAGRQIARGEFIQYLDSDDLLLPRKFELQVSGLRAAPECGASYGYTRYVHAGGSVEAQPWKRSGETIATMFPAFLQSRWWDTPTPLYRRSVTDSAGPWTNLRLEEDWEYDARVAALGVKLHQVRDWVAEVRDHSENRLCRGAALDAARLRERARAHALIFDSASSAGITAAEPEMQHFARELFLLARQAGAAGLAREAEQLFRLARRASGERGSAIDFRLYEAIAKTIGWNAIGRLACMTDALRR